MYSHRNKINGKQYIGITSQIPEIRWGTNGRNYDDSPKFWKAIQKYGWDSFDHIILADNLSKEEAREMEMKTIKDLDTIKNGYNISPGGDMPPTFRGADHPKYHKHPSEETRMKMRLNHADFSNGKHPRAKPIICLETGKVYETITQAARELHGTRDIFNACCRGDIETYKGFHWQYYKS